MSILTLVRRAAAKVAAVRRVLTVRNAKRFLRASSIRRLEQDIDWAKASSDAHIRGLEQKLDRLKAAQDQRNAQDVARDMSRFEKGVA